MTLANKLKGVASLPPMAAGVYATDFKFVNGNSTVVMNIGQAQSDRILIIGGYVGTTTGWPNDIKVNGVSVDTVCFAASSGTAGGIFGTIALPAGSSATIEIVCSGGVSTLSSYGIGCWATYGGLITTGVGSFQAAESSSATSRSYVMAAGTIHVAVGATQSTPSLSDTDAIMVLDYNNIVGSSGYLDAGHIYPTAGSNTILLAQTALQYCLLYGTSIT